MDDAIFSYAKNKISSGIENSHWEDKIGQLFQSELVPELKRSIDRIAASGEDLQRLADQIERKISECSTERKF